MKVLLVTPPTKDQPLARDMAGGLGFDGGHSIVLPPLDLAYMASTLLTRGDQVKIVDSDVENYHRNLAYRIIEEYKPEVIIASVSLPSIYRDCSFLQEIHRHSSAKVIVKTGITYPPLLREILEKSSADLCIFGECDINIKKIIAGEEKKGTAYLKDGELKVEKNNIITNLDELPLPARNLLPNEKYRYILLGDKVTTMQTTRGCPFPCAYYCPYPLVQGKKWRARNPEHVITEIEDIIKRYKIRKILFRDATFTFNKKRTEKICDLILQKGLKFEWWCETRIDYLDQPLIKRMKEAGCQGMNIGVETGDPELLESQAKPGASLKKLKQVNSFCKDIGLKLHFLLMLGLPEERRKSLYRTYNLIQSLRPESIGTTFVVPYPGTPLYYEAKEKDRLETEDWSKYGGHFPVMHTDHLSVDNLVHAKRMIVRGFRLSRRSGLLNKIRQSRIERKLKQWIRGNQ